MHMLHEACQERDSMDNHVSEHLLHACCKCFHFMKKIKLVHTIIFDQLHGIYTIYFTEHIILIIKLDHLHALIEYVHGT